LSEGDVWLPKPTVPQCWPGAGKTAVTELVVWSHDQACSIVSRPQRMADCGGNQHTFVNWVHRSGAANEW